MLSVLRAAVSILLPWTANRRAFLEVLVLDVAAACGQEKYAAGSARVGPSPDRRRYICARVAGMSPIPRRRCIFQQWTDAFNVLDSAGLSLAG